eukprot:7143774-Pyramimonas_sp.AAC.1
MGVGCKRWAPIGSLSTGACVCRSCSPEAGPDPRRHDFVHSVDTWSSRPTPLGRLLISGRF